MEPPGGTPAPQTPGEALSQAFQEASRLKLLRLGSTLRAASDELGRFTRGDNAFSRGRLCFFLGRSWLLARGLAQALRNEDEATFTRLLWTPPAQPVAKLDVVTLGVSKRVVANAFCAFEFRLRAVKAADPLAKGQRLIWSCVFPLKPGVAVPAEGFLHLPQKQKFAAIVFLEPKVLTLTKCLVAVDPGGLGRLTLTDASAVTEGKPFKSWNEFSTWDPAAALDRLRAHEPTPFDLEIELQEEVVFADWNLEAEEGKESDGDEDSLTLWGDGLPHAAVLPPGPEGKRLRQVLQKAAKEKRPPPLYGLMHYEKARLMVQPLALLGDRGPVHLQISNEKLDKAALLKALSFT